MTILERREIGKQHERIMNEGFEDLTWKDCEDHTEY